MLFRNISMFFLMCALIFAGCAKDDEESTECTTTSFTFDNQIHPLCGIDDVGNHVIIKNLHLNGGTFTIYARTDANGNNGGKFTFSGTTVNAEYRGGGVTTGSNTATVSQSNFLIGFHQENPAVHVIVKQASSVETLESAADLLNIEPNNWANQGSPASEAFYYKGSSGVTLESVKVFHEEHHH